MMVVTVVGDGNGADTARWYAWGRNVTGDVFISASLPKDEVDVNSSELGGLMVRRRNGLTTFKPPS